jgi:hypothetical protein
MGSASTLIVHCVAQALVRLRLRAPSDNWALLGAMAAVSAEPYFWEESLRMTFATRDINGRRY